MTLRCLSRYAAPSGSVSQLWLQLSSTSRRYFTKTSILRAKELEKSVIQELEERGFVAALTSPKLHQHVQSPTTIYAGVDPSASSLHVGNLLPLLGLLHFQAKGHQSIALIGGATGSIGDPSGRSTERKSLSQAELQTNVEGITSQIHRFFETGSAYLKKRGIVRAGAESSPTTFKGKGKEEQQDVEVGFGVKVMNNLDWTKDVSLLGFLRDVGKLARVSVMLSRDSVKNRLTSDSGISYTEFTYQLLQAFDFSHLYKQHGCKIQMGGSDQWGNIVAGIDLIKRSHPLSTSSAGSSSSTVNVGQEGQEGVEAGTGAEDVEAFGITIPLLTTSTGEKFGKSAGNAVWLDEKRTSAAEFYQFFLRTTDEDVGRYLRIFTFLPLDEIEQVMTEHDSLKSDRNAQKLLAREVTELVHGLQGLAKAITSAQVLYSTDTASLRAEAVLKAFEGDNKFHRVPLAEVEGVPVGKLAVTFGLCSSRSEANRLIQSSGLSLNESKVADIKTTVSRDDLVDGHVAILRVGSKRQAILYLD
ncbi:tyrosine-tRNA ligase [Kwoniella heveanensis CBS 569]|uniref:tyrosine--tRNA ligase n=1 Tax=Kwoniella heveanensis BCC8398 TaxID=1296120 RepID=A0A1B9GSC8_9TREE|nr:tyrosine-tRNA ligase [Kwoniella heveanensis BCC8398]OCF39274.1 tyrosine-tRNA ligase [Kwoniella heveanensis CBS 569]